MQSHPFLAVALVATAIPAAAQETREMGAHEHGVSTVQVAVEDGTVTIDLHAPGMDVVGFEHEPESADDMRLVSGAVLQLTRASEIVELDAGAACLIVEVLAHRHGHGHGGYEGAADDHEHGEEEHSEEAHSEEAEGDHSEFHARYVFACEDADALSEISFPFFERFEGAREIEAEYVTAAGAGADELAAESATLSLD